MTKKIKKLEKESINWRQRYERATGNLLTLAQDKQVVDGKLECAKKKSLQLETLSRALMEDRNELRKIVQAANSVADGTFRL
jgi:hypothetical protein